MLDQPTEGADAPTPPDKEEEFYVPPLAGEALNGRAPAPSVKRFNRRTLALLTGIAAIIVTLAFAVGLQRPTRKVASTAESAAPSPLPGAVVSALPGSYQDYGSASGHAQVPQLGEPRPGDVGGFAASNGAQALSSLEQYQQQQEMERLKRQDQARISTVGFSGGGAGVEAGLTRAVGSVDPAAAALSDRLLDVAERSVAGPAAATSARDDDNRQDDKARFADKDRDTDFQLRHGVQYPRSPFTLFAGTLVPCVMTQGIDSDLPGQIGCMVSQNVYDTVTGRHLLIPQGTRAIGTYDSRIAYGQSRVLVVWTRLLRPDGSWVSLEGMPGTDLSGYAGLTGPVNNHYMRLISGVVLGSIIGAGAQVGAGANNQNPSFSELAVQGAAQNINQAGQQITRKNLQIQPTIEVRPGSRLNIFATKDLILPPYRG
jgi:type IV secretory pathway VirB10-like protein